MIGKSSKMQEMTFKQESNEIKNSILGERPKELWQTLKICLKSKNGFLFDSLSVGETFKKMLLISRKPCVKTTKNL